MFSEKEWQNFLTKLKEIKSYNSAILELAEFRTIDPEKNEILISYAKESLLTIVQKQIPEINRLIADFFGYAYQLRVILKSPKNQDKFLSLGSESVKKTFEKNERQRLKFERILQQNFLQELEKEQQLSREELNYAESFYQELNKAKSLLLYKTEISLKRKSGYSDKTYVNPFETVIDVCRERIEDLQNEFFDNLNYLENLEKNKKNYITSLLAEKRLDLEFLTINKQLISLRYLKIDDHDDLFLCILYCYDSQGLALGDCFCSKNNHDEYLLIPINRIELDTILHELYIKNYTQEKYLNAGDLREMIFEQE